MDKIRIREILALCVLLAGIFQVFMMTTHPVFKNNDSPETTAAAATLGIGHPPGYPLYSMAGKAAVSLLPYANPAFRMNVFASFLALVALFITYFTVKRIFDKIYGGRLPAAWIPGYAAVIILAFSYIFWNQAIEAKGGIYILNLIFLSALIYLSLVLFDRFKLKYIYFAAYIFGLSLSNHWPSMIILLPVFAYSVYEHRRSINLRSYTIIILLFLLGLTPYIYLPLRAASGPVLNWGDPSTPGGFLWVVMRKGYVYPVQAGIEVYKYQLAEFFSLFFTNYSLFWAAGLAGAAVFMKRNRKTFLFLTSIFMIVFIMVVLYNRTEKGVIWLMNIFLMPALYVMLLFVSAGCGFILKKVKKKKYIAAAAGISVLVFTHMFLRGFERNNYSRDFLSYDFGRNILMTMERGAMYHGDGDFNLMPIYYIREIQGHRRDIKFVTSSVLIFNWGIEDFINKYGKVPMEPLKAAENAANAILFFVDRVPVYRSVFYSRADKMKTGLVENQKGLLIKYSRQKETYGPEIFDLYSYRGVFSNFTKYHTENSGLVGWYPVSMVNQASALMAAGYNAESIELNKRSLNFPNEKPEGNILYNISLAYSNMNDNYNELLYLEKAMEKKSGLVAVYERAGYHYYHIGLMDNAEKAFNTALKMGSTDENVKKGLMLMKEFSRKDRFDIALTKGNEYVSKRNIEIANKIYDFLLENDFRKDIIYMNKGVYCFETKDYVKALEYFNKSKNETESAQIYLYIAYTLVKLKMMSKALNTVKQGLEKFNNDAGLINLKEQLKGAAVKDAKNSYSADR